MANEIRGGAPYPCSAAIGKTDRRFVRLLVGPAPVTVKEAPMKRVIVPVVVVLVIGLSQVLWAEPLAKERGKELAALEQKMLGAWKGRTTCDERLVFRADGSDALKGYGPAND